MSTELHDILQFPVGKKLATLTELLLEETCSSQTAELAAQVLLSGEGSIELRNSLAVALGKVGDPRLLLPTDTSYWAPVELEGYSLEVGKNLVTTAEWKLFVNSERYGDESLWDDEGLAWKSKERPSWQVLAKSADGIKFAVDNQPVVGVSWYEAKAYALANGARLLDFDERIQIVRGSEKRHYPWGSPFGQGNANTVEESLGRPCAVGLFLRDKTPEGICDLAGNVAEWTSDYDGKRRIIHPGSWRESAMASWPKASRWISAAARLDSLGFRIVREVN